MDDEIRPSVPGQEMPAGEGAAEATPPSPPPVRELKRHPVSFTGTGGEYFRIWIVNLVLSVLTLGIYSAWAKVRRLQYFYRHTHVADSSFDYHGPPLAILKGRIIAAIMFGAYFYTGQATQVTGSPAMLGAYFGIVLCIMLVMPYLLAKSFRFRLANASYRGLRFGFHGSVKRAYIVFLLLPIATGFTMYLLWPFVHQRIKDYVHGNASFGQGRFSFHAQASGFYRIYLFAVLMGMVIATPMVIAVILRSSAASAVSHHGEQMIAFGIFGSYGAMILSSLIVRPYFDARMQNLIWNGTRLEQHGFSSDVDFKGLFKIMAGNFFLTILTLGLYRPFAVIRTLRYKLDHMTMLSMGELETFVADAQQKTGAIGVETAAIFDIDISL